MAATTNVYRVEAYRPGLNQFKGYAPGPFLIRMEGDPEDFDEQWTKLLCRRFSLSYPRKFYWEDVSIDPEDVDEQEWEVMATVNEDGIVSDSRIASIYRLTLEEFSELSEGDLISLQPKKAAGPLDQNKLSEYMDLILDKVGDDPDEAQIHTLMLSLDIPREYQEELAKDLGFEIPEVDFKRIYMTPSQWDFLLKAKEHGKVPIAPLRKMPHTSKTVKALMGKDLIGQEKNGDFILTERGKRLVAMTPRWSGETKDEFGRMIQTWCVYDMGHVFSNFTPGKPKMEDRKDLKDEHESTNVFNGKTFQSKLLRP